MLRRVLALTVLLTLTGCIGHPPPPPPWILPFVDCPASLPNCHQAPEDVAASPAKPHAATPAPAAAVSKTGAAKIKVACDKKTGTVGKHKPCQKTEAATAPHAKAKAKSGHKAKAKTATGASMAQPAGDATAPEPAAAPQAAPSTN